MASTRASIPRLLAGPPLRVGSAESLADHHARLGPLPTVHRRGGLIQLIEASGLLGRGGGAFPVGTKWRSVAGRHSGGATVLVNGAEGEPGSAKDQALMVCRPHLVLDGAELAALAVDASEIVVYVGEEHRSAVAALGRAIGERSRRSTVPFRLVTAPRGYVSGQESAAVHFVDAGDARPTTPYRPFERGIGGEPTLVQNVESLADVALIARYGADWFRTAGRGPTPGTALVTVSGAGQARGVYEIELGTPLGELLATAGVDRSRVGAVLLGGYGGAWARPDLVSTLPLDPIALRERGLRFGAGVVTLLDTGECGVEVTAAIMAYMAGESAAQCGPCVYGLASLAEATERLAAGNPRRDDLQRTIRWAEMVRGRGACAHPDGAVGVLASAFDVFGDEFRAHQAGRCSLMTGEWRAA
jgi:NADH:ubiquinone oxidoreductase subunit F (NADH-binding)